MARPLATVVQQDLDDPVTAAVAAGADGHLAQWQGTPKKWRPSWNSSWTTVAPA
ncbi:MAG: hypothetical protein ACR2HY_11015 [Acidimicrobiales bacterium]